MRTVALLGAVTFITSVSVVGCRESSTGPLESSNTMTQYKPLEASLTCGTTVMESIALTADLLECPGDGIIIGADGVVLDGRGHRITGVGSGNGITLHDRSGVTIKNVTISGFSIGVSLHNASQNKLTRNVLMQDNRGIRLWSSSDNEISRSEFDSNYLAIRLLRGSNNNVVLRNILTGGQANSINLQNSTGNSIVANDLSDNAWSIDLYQSDSNTVARNSVAGTRGGSGYRLESSNSNTLVGNRSHGNVGGGFLVTQASSGNELRRNRAEGNGGHGFEAVASAGGNSFVGNVSTQNTGFGYHDLSSGGTGTLGTDNDYTRNRCSNNVSGPSLPAGLCR